MNRSDLTSQNPGVGIFLGRKNKERSQTSEAKKHAGGWRSVAAEPSGNSFFNEFFGTNKSMAVMTALAALAQPPALAAVMRRFLPSQRAQVTVSQASAPLGGLVKMSGNNCTTRRQGWREGEEEKG